MPDISYDYDAMKRAATNLRTKQTEIEKALNSAQQQVKDITAGEFKTQVASRELSDAQDRFTTNTKKSLEALNRMGQFLESAVQAQQDLDSDSGSVFRNSVS